MAYPTHFINVTSIGARHMTGGAPVGTNTDPIERLISLSVKLRRRPVVGKNDHADYPVVLDVVHEGYQWAALHRDLDQAKAWTEESYMRDIGFRIHPATTGDDWFVWMQGVAVTDVNFEVKWGNLVGFATSGFASRCLVYGTNAPEGVTETPHASSSPLEGDLTINGMWSSNNAPTNGDLTNHWEAFLGIT